MAAAPKLSILRGIDDTLVYAEDCLLAVAGLLVDPTYHRPRNPTGIQKMAEAWDPIAWVGSRSKSATAAASTCGTGSTALGR